MHFEGMRIQEKGSDVCASRMSTRVASIQFYPWPVGQ